LCKPINRRNTFFHWQSYQFTILVSWTMLFQWFIFWFYFKIFGYKPIDRRITLWDWQSCQFETLVSWRTMIKILQQMITLIYFLILLDGWAKIDWREKYPLRLAILSTYNNCKLKNTHQNFMINYPPIYFLIISRYLCENQLTGEILSSIGNLLNIEIL
jgi:hypothetical protein